MPPHGEKRLTQRFKSLLLVLVTTDQLATILAAYMDAEHDRMARLGRYDDVLQDLRDAIGEALEAQYPNSIISDQVIHHVEPVKERVAGLRDDQVQMAISVKYTVTSPELHPPYAEEEKPKAPIPSSMEF